MHLVVDEGAPVKIDNLATEGLDPVGDKAQDIQHDLKLTFKRGDTFDYGKYLGKKGEVEMKLKALGFAWANVQGEVDVDRDAKTADVLMKVDPGPMARYGHVYLRGYEVINPRLILAHVDRKRASRSIRAARGRARPHLQPRRLLVGEGGVRSRRDERRRGRRHHQRAQGQLHELRLGGGVGFESTRYDIHLAGQYIKHNFLGGLRTLKLRLEPGWVFLVNPGSVGATTGSVERPVAGARQATFTQPDFSRPGTTSSGRRLRRRHRLRLPVSRPAHDARRDAAGVAQPRQPRALVQLQVPHVLQHRAGVPDEPARAARLFGYTNPYRVGWFQEDFTLDLRDKPLGSAQGRLLRHQHRGGRPLRGRLVHYEKVLPEARLYAPLGRRVTFATRAMFGQMFVQGDLGSPITRRFYMGGPDSHRGFNYNRLSLQVPSAWAHADAADRRRSAAAHAGRVPRQHRQAVRQLVRRHRRSLDAGDVRPRVGQRGSWKALAPALSPAGMCRDGGPVKL